MSPTRIESRPGVPRAWPESRGEFVSYAEGREDNFRPMFGNRGVAQLRGLMVYLGMRSDGPDDVMEY